MGTAHETLSVEAAVPARGRRRTRPLAMCVSGAGPGGLPVPRGARRPGALTVRGGVVVPVPGLHDEGEGALQTREVQSGAAAPPATSRPPSGLPAPRPPALGSADGLQPYLSRPQDDLLPGAGLPPVSKPQRAEGAGCRGQWPTPGQPNWLRSARTARRVPGLPRDPAGTQTPANGQHRPHPAAGRAARALAHVWGQTQGRQVWPWPLPSPAPRATGPSSPRP